MFSISVVARVPVTVVVVVRIIISNPSSCPSPSKQRMFPNVVVVAKQDKDARSNERFRPAHASAALVRLLSLESKER